MTWMPAGLPANSANYWDAVVSSADGTKLAASGNGLVYSSVDSGATWTAANAPVLAYGSIITSSADGSKLVALGAGEVCTVQLPIAPSLPPSTPSPRLGIRSAGGGLLISWLVPSTRFVLEQNLDLTAPNWTDVVVVPTLNLTNLQLEVSTSPSAGRRFYRLKQP